MPRQTSRARPQQKLKVVLQFDCADLDLGVCRILNVKRAEFTKFLEGELDRVLDAHLSGSPKRMAKLNSASGDSRVDQICGSLLFSLM